MAAGSEISSQEAIFGIERPCKSLWTFYLLSSLLMGPLFFIPIIPLYFRYHTLRYRFDAEGIAMKWGILFRREVTLTYARIQDIHLTSNIVERWLGLARIQIQTASGSAQAEMTIEGLKEFDAVRDFLYSKMRGIKAGGALRAEARHAAAEPVVEAGVSCSPSLAATLTEVAKELRAVRDALEAGGRRGH